MIFKDTRKLGDTAATMVDAVLNGKTPEVNDTETYNNKVKVVPSYLHESVIITRTTWLRKWSTRATTPWKKSRRACKTA